MIIILQTTFFLFLFVSVLVGLHFYPIHRFLSLFVTPYKHLSLAIALLASLLTFLGYALNRFYHCQILAFIQDISSFWLGSIFIIFFVVLVLHLISLFIPLTPKLNLIFSIIITLSIIFYGVFEASRLHITQITITSDKITKPYTFVHLSDIHLEAISQKYFKNIIEQTKNQNPDFVFITGDFIDLNNIDPKRLEILNQLKTPIFYSFGNHEFYIKQGEPKKALKNTKVIILRNQAVQFDELQIIGIDDFHRGQKKMIDLLKNVSVDNNKYSILLSHQPKQVDTANKLGIDLMLSGHTHAGQIFPFTLMARLKYNYMYGLYDTGHTKIYVTSGAGYWGPKMRLGSKNEIAVIKIKNNAM